MVSPVLKESPNLPTYNIICMEHRPCLLLPAPPAPRPQKACTSEHSRWQSSPPVVSLQCLCSELSRVCPVWHAQRAELLHWLWRASWSEGLQTQAWIYCCPVRKTVFASHQSNPGFLGVSIPADKLIVNMVLITVVHSDQWRHVGVVNFLKERSDSGEWCVQCNSVSAWFCAGGWHPDSDSMLNCGHSLLHAFLNARSTFT